MKTDIIFIKHENLSTWKPALQKLHLKKKYYTIET